MSFLTEAVSRIGGREINEDSYGFLEMNHNACWIVADGLGGHRGGENASRIAVEAALASFRATPEFSAAALQHHLDAAQQAILQAQKKQPSFSTMRTTIVMLLTDSQRALWAHVGDSRLYCLENGRIVFCTKDHSVVQAMVNAGELQASQIRHHEDRNRLLRCLGNSEADFRPTILFEPRTLQGGEAFLLCSDGFWEGVTEPEIEIDFAKAEGTREWLALMESRLLERTTEDSDNYTAIAVRVDSEMAPNADDSLSSSLKKSRFAIKTRLARLGLLGVLLIALEIPALHSWNDFKALERKVRDLTEERDALWTGMLREKNRLEDSQNQLQNRQKVSTTVATGSSVGSDKK
jgi:serine/threonine protein phosphatase PrpC